MKNKTTPVFRIAFAMYWHNEQLCFVFRGASKQVVCNVFSNMNNLCGDCCIEYGKLSNILNGKPYRSVTATVTEPRTDILPEADWPIMIERLLHKPMPCEVTYYDDINKLLNV